ncbi:MAG: hypothetical protein DRJ01_02455 [Bacteroidetes bacterium]|nr:MAG: hypothetical protein DRJ01_02455 [Bacteroidota bacterium]
MKRTHYIFNLLFLIALSSNVLLAQEQENNEQKNPDEEFVHNNKIYKPNSSWLSFGVGSSYDINQKQFEQSINFDLHVRIKKTFVSGGYHKSSDAFFQSGTVQQVHSIQTLNDIHLCVGLKREKFKSNLSLFAGPSYVYGTTYDFTDSLNVDWYRKFDKPGIYASIQYTYKIFYDVGVGASLYTSINKYYSVVGIQLHLYFSNALKGTIR